MSAGELIVETMCLSDGAIQRTGAPVAGLRTDRAAVGEWPSPCRAEVFARAARAPAARDRVARAVSVPPRAG